MEYELDASEDIMEAVRYIHQMRGKKYMTREEKEMLNRAKLRIAYWACRSEGIVASRDNLEYVMGADAFDIIKAYDKYLITEEERAQREKLARRKKQRKDSGKFWGGASGDR